MFGWFFGLLDWWWWIVVYAIAGAIVGWRLVIDDGWESALAGGREKPVGGDWHGWQGLVLLSVVLWPLILVTVVVEAIHSTRIGEAVLTGPPRRIRRKMRKQREQHHRDNVGFKSGH